MIVQIIGWFCLILFCIQFTLCSFMPSFKELKGFYIIDNSLLLIAAAICFK